MEGGKVFILCNSNDARLMASKFSNFGERMGRYGPDAVRDDLKDVVAIVDTTPDSNGEPVHFDDKMHSYHWEEWAVKVYDNPEAYADRTQIIPGPGVPATVWELLTIPFWI